MEAKVDKECCIQCGLCTEICPEVFEMGPDGKSQVKVSPVPPEAEADCLDAKEQCPAGCIETSD